MLNGVFEKTIKDKLISNNPCKYIDILMLKKHCLFSIVKTTEKRTVSDKQMAMMYKIFQKDHNEKPEYIPTYAVELATLTGMRYGELPGLVWENIDFDNKYLIVAQLEKKKYIIFLVLKMGRTELFHE